MLDTTAGHDEARVAGIGAARQEAHQAVVAVTRSRGLTLGLVALLIAACGGAAPAPAASVETARCAALTATDVTRALDAAPFYSYRAVGYLIRPVPFSMEATPRPLRLDTVLTGAYQAPDRWRQIGDWQPSTDPAAYGDPDQIVIGAQHWIRHPYSDQKLWTLMPASPSTPGPATALAPSGGPLQQEWLGLAARRAPWSAGAADPAGSDTCVFSSHLPTQADGSRWELTLWVAPVSALPTRLLVDFVNSSGFHWYLDHTIDTVTAVRVDPPAPADVQPPSSTP